MHKWNDERKYIISVIILRFGQIRNHDLSFRANLTKRKRKFHETLYIRNIDTSGALKYQYSMRMIQGMANEKMKIRFSLFSIARSPSFSGRRCKSTIVISCRFSITSSTWAIASPLPFTRIPFFACPAAKVKEMLNFLSSLTRKSLTRSHYIQLLFYD